MRALHSRGVDKDIYLWSDDNLSNDYFWRYLAKDDIDLVASYRNYGRVVCFKGFDRESFEFNTGASAELFEGQFTLLHRFLELGLDLYCYVTLTTPNDTDIEIKMCRFIDRLQDLDSNLPLRVVPLEISVFSPVARRLNDTRNSALRHQWPAVEIWQRELERRFSLSARALPICDVQLENRLGSY